MTRKAVILLSGGLDSTTVLALAKAQGFTLYGLSLDYGQRHKCELRAAQKIALAYQVMRHEILTLDLARFGQSALTDKTIAVPSHNAHHHDIPVTYVPGRNTVMLALALSWAESLGGQDIFFGANVVDYSNYPDCRPEYIAAMRQLAQLSSKQAVTGKSINIHTPLLNMSKAEIIQQGLILGVDYSATVSCYQATDDGRACGRCAACCLRREGFEKAKVLDPTLYL